MIQLFPLWFGLVVFNADIGLIPAWNYGCASTHGGRHWSWLVGWWLAPLNLVAGAGTQRAACTDLVHACLNS